MTRQLQDKHLSTEPSTIKRVLFEDTSNVPISQDQIQKYIQDPFKHLRGAF